jgi:hypothetical protein
VRACCISVYVFGVKNNCYSFNTGTSISAINFKTLSFCLKLINRIASGKFLTVYVYGDGFKVADLC